MTRTRYFVVALAGLAFLTACGSRTATPQAAAVPVAATRSADAPPAPAGPPDLTGANAPGGVSSEAPDENQPVPEPTVAKTQKWVKIFSGPSTRDIKPPADKKRGSRTVELNVVQNAQIGPYVTDGAGRTLYRFDNDRARPPKSTCNGDCATAWPPLLIKSPGKIYPSGIDPKIIGYVERADGTCQVTINGQPVYFFITDEKPGDLNGQGVNDKWFAVAPDGARTRAIPGFPLSSTTK
jgi:predicted lipoprotein with Yx(FWY)xxD motif